MQHPAKDRISSNRQQELRRRHGQRAGRDYAAGVLPAARPQARQGADAERRLAGHAGESGAGRVCRLTGYPLAANSAAAC
jgi:hypothetical protein